VSDALSEQAKANRQPDRIRKLQELQWTNLPTEMWGCDCCGGIFWTNEAANYCPYCSTEVSQ